MLGYRKGPMLRDRVGYETVFVHKTGYGTNRKAWCGNCGGPGIALFDGPTPYVTLPSYIGVFTVIKYDRLKKFKVELDVCPHCGSLYASKVTQGPFRLYRRSRTCRKWYRVRVKKRKVVQ